MNLLFNIIIVICLITTFLALLLGLLHTAKSGDEKNYLTEIKNITGNIICDDEILKHIKPGVVVSGTRIEPPLHPQGPEKVLMDFGIEPEEIQEQELKLALEKTSMNATYMQLQKRLYLPTIFIIKRP